MAACSAQSAKKNTQQQCLLLIHRPHCEQFQNYFVFRHCKEGTMYLCMDERLDTAEEGTINVYNPPCHGHDALIHEVDGSGNKVYPRKNIASS